MTHRVWSVVFVILLVGAVVWLFQALPDRPGEPVASGEETSVDAIDPTPGTLVETARDTPRESARSPGWHAVLLDGVTEDDEAAVATGSIHGRLAWRDGGLPVVGARVSLQRAPRDTVIPEPGEDLTPPQEDPDLVTVTSPLGAFELNGVPSRDNLFLRFAIDDGTVEIADLRTSPAAGGRAWQGEYLIERRGALTGQVVDPEGAPISGVRVRAVDELRFDEPGVPWEVREQRVAGAETMRLDGLSGSRAQRRSAWLRDRRLPYPTTTTDAEGRFELCAVREGDAQLILQHEELVAQRITVPIQAGRTTDLGVIPLARGVPITVRVIDRRLVPIVGLKLAVRALGWRFGPAPERTDGRGEVTFRLDVDEDVGNDALAVEVSARRGLGDGWVTLGTARSPGAEFVLEDRQDVELRIETVGGAAVPDELRLTSEPKIPNLRWSGSGTSYRVAGIAPEVGCELYGIAAGRAPAVAYVSGSRPIRRRLDLDPDSPEYTELPQAAEMRVAAMRFAPSFGARILVVDELRRPVPGARVTFSATGAIGSIKLDGGALLHDLPLGTTDADGVLEVEGLWRGTLLFTASHPARGRAHQLRNSMQLAPGVTIEIQLTAVGSLSGVIVEGAVPVTRRYRVHAEQNYGELIHLGRTLRDPLTVVSNDEGRFAMPRIGGGEWWMSVTDPDAPDAGAAFQVSRGRPSELRVRQPLEPGREIEITLDLKEAKGRPTVTGTVRTAGMPTAGVRVELWGREWWTRPDAGGSHLIAVTAPDARGHFELGGEPRGEAELRISIERRGVLIPVAAAPLPERSRRGNRPPVDFDIPIGDLVVEVSDRDGLALANRPVALETASGARILVIADERGFVQEDGIPAGSYRLAARGKSGTPLTFEEPIVVPAGGSLFTRRRGR